MAETPQPTTQSNLIVIGFGNEYAADAMISKLEEWKEQGLIDIEDGVRARRGVTDHVDLDATPLTGFGSVRNGRRNPLAHPKSRSV